MQSVDNLMQSPQLVADSHNSSICIYTEHVHKNYYTGYA